MLKLTSRFVLEVLPYLLSALIAAVLVPGFLSSLYLAITGRGPLSARPKAARLSPGDTRMRCHA